MKDFIKQISYMESLPPQHKSMIKMYTDTYDKLINPKLSGIESEPLTRVEKTLVDTLNYTIAHAPPLEHDVIVYRGLQERPNINRTGFSSTTPNKDIAERFMKDDRCCLMKIVLKKGSKVLPLVGHEFTFVRGSDGEEEVLLGTGTWTVKGKEYTYNNSDFTTSTEPDEDILTLVYVLSNMNPKLWQARALSGKMDPKYVIFITVKALYPQENVAWWHSQTAKIQRLMHEEEFDGPIVQPSPIEAQVDLAIANADKLM